MTAKLPAADVTPIQVQTARIVVPTLVGLAGRAGAGKDTVADEMVSRTSFTKFSFSDALYTEVAEAFKVEDSFLRDRATKEAQTTDLALCQCSDVGFYGRMCWQEPHISPLKPQSPRSILQWWGTEYRREQHPDYWVRRAAEFYLAGISKGGGPYVNTSVRFVNEAQWIRKMGGLVIQVDRPGEPMGGHCSEQPLDRALVAAWVENGSTPEDLYWQVMSVFALLRTQCIPV